MIIMEDKGWYQKYLLKKINGDPVSPEAEYFVLRLDSDPHARAAALAYANSIEKENPTFAKDIRDKVKQYEQPQ